MEYGAIIWNPYTKQEITKLRVDTKERGKIHYQGLQISRRGDCDQNLIYHHYKTRGNTKD
jgi:hypothetical protein